MNFKKHFQVEGRHAFLGASKSSWVNYDVEKLRARYRAHKAAQRGTELHALAHDLIRKEIMLPDVQKTFNLYVNDAIKYGMRSEQTLFFSLNSFGTPDTIGFDRVEAMLRIHDLKTGVTATSERQLKVYAAQFCLEYRISPFDIDIELRIYQSDEIRIYEPDPDEIVHIMDKIISFDRVIAEEDMEEGLA